jgi:hypothetical protein
MPADHVLASHVLDRPIWTALDTRHAHFSSGGELARRYPAEVSPFVMGRDHSPEAVAEMAALIGEGEDISVVEVDPPAAPAGVSETRLPLHQMVWDRFPGVGETAFDIQPLGESDAAEMLALATLTKPGPFRSRTHTMGRFVGVREGGKLIAMAGERLHAPGYASNATAIALYRKLGFVVRADVTHALWKRS